MLDHGVPAVLLQCVKVWAAGAVSLAVVECCSDEPRGLLFTVTSLYITAYYVSNYPYSEENAWLKFIPEKHFSQRHMMLFWCAVGTIILMAAQCLI